MTTHGAIHRKQLPRFHVSHPHWQRIFLEQQTERGLTALQVRNVDPDPDASPIARAPLLDTNPLVSGQMLLVRIPRQGVASHLFLQALFLPPESFGILAST